MTGIVSKLGNSPYCAVIFASVKRSEIEGYSEIAQKMWEFGHSQDGFLGVAVPRQT